MMECVIVHLKPGVEFSDSDIEEVDRRHVETSLTFASADSFLAPTHPP